MRLRTIAFAVLVVLALCATASWAANVYSENVGPGTLAVGNRGDSWAKFRVTGASGALTAVPTATTGTAWSIDARTLTSGNAVKIVADDDILNGGYYVNFLGGATGTDSVFSIGELGAIDSTGTIDVWADGLVAGGDRAIVGAITQSTAVALTGTLVGVYARATGGDTGGAGTVRGCEIGGRVTDSTGKIASVVTGGYFWADAKQRQATTLRGLEVSLDGGGSATSTLATGVQVFNNSSGTQTTSVAYDINEGNPSGRKAFTYDLRMQNGETVSNATDGLVAFSSANVDLTRSLSGQSTENLGHTISMTTDSSYLTGSDITYTSARGSSALKIAGIYSGVAGGYSNIHSTVTHSSDETNSGAGVIGIKQIVTNTGTMTDGSIYGGQFWAKHAHATKKMANEAPLIGLEGIAYVSAAAPAGTIIGVNAGYHNEGSTAKDGGAVYRGLQIVCDDAAGSTAPSEATGLAVWNMAGTQTNGIWLVKSDGGFTTDIKLQNSETISNATDGAIALSGTLTAPAVTSVSDATDTRVCTSADYGKIIVLSHADNVAVTLPANGAAAGSWIDFMLAGNDSLAVVISAATNDTMVGPNSAGLDSVTWGSGSRIGAYGRLISDGSVWHALNLGGTTMTYTE